MVCSSSAEHGIAADAANEFNAKSNPLQLDMRAGWGILKKHRLPTFDGTLIRHQGRFS